MERHSDIRSKESLCDMRCLQISAFQMMRFTKGVTCRSIHTMVTQRAVKCFYIANDAKQMSGQLIDKTVECCEGSCIYSRAVKDIVQ